MNRKAIRKCFTLFIAFIVFIGILPNNTIVSFAANNDIKVSWMIEPNLDVGNLFQDSIYGTVDFNDGIGYHINVEGLSSKGEVISSDGKIFALKNLESVMYRSGGVVVTLGMSGTQQAIFFYDHNMTLLGKLELQGFSGAIFPIGFSEGLLAVKSSGAVTTQTGYYNTKGELVLSGYDEVQPFSNGVALVKKSGTVALIDKNGNIVSTYPNFQNSLDGEQIYLTGGMIVKYSSSNSTLYEMFNLAGEKISDVAFKARFSEGFIRKGRNANTGTTEYIDKNGNVKLSIPSDTAGDVSDGLISAVVQGDNYSRRQVFYDTSGSIVLNLGYTTDEVFHNGLLLVKNDNGKYGYIDQSGKIVVPYEYDQARPFSNGFAWVQKNLKWGVLKVDSAGIPSTSTPTQPPTSTTQSQTFPPYAIKTLEVVGGLPSTINTDTTLKFIATTDTSVTKVLFSDNYFFGSRNDLETVTSSNGVFQTTKSYTFNEGSHIIYCFPIDADGNVVWDNGLGIDEASRSYGASLNVVRSTGGGFNGGFQGESISVGAKFRWGSTSDVIGYRVYRSDSSSDEGISITDFYITSNEFVDVNVKPNRTYYYTVRGVIAEAKPFDGIPEQLTPPSERITVNTPSTILGDDLQPPSPSATKKFILMTLDDPYMTINGTKEEIDPGRGTTPLLLNSRTMVPIRAIVEGMGGTIGWNEAAREVSLNYQPNVVKMTLDKEQFTVNGTEKTADVPPTSINGRTMLPIRFAAESLGCAIDWLNSTKQVVIVYY